ncbi:zinc finger protein 717-like isoform X2 [Corythoichthys intestinalis]|uniref:zinc finger protein 717-like isoform X2 n=1 Tax=Corythoichthys intestinalis TaxID=161448 RepID=UPI0025A5FE30|nr:zinc finger protein 717-like isoform X2 [Corythoichthys intestinalis]
MLFSINPEINCTEQYPKLPDIKVATDSRSQNFFLSKPQKCKVNCFWKGPADVPEEYFNSKHQVPEYPNIGEENANLAHSKGEEKEADIIKFIFTGVPLNSEAEDKGQHMENRKVEPSSSSSSCRITTEDKFFAPLSDSDEITYHSDTDNDESSKGDLIRHTVNKRVKCSLCDNTFFNKSSLKRHFMTHTGEKPFACSVCGKTFRINGDLKIHMRIHTGEKPFACSICGKGFTQRGHLRSHVRTHTGEKPKGVPSAT